MLAGAAQAAGLNELLRAGPSRTFQRFAVRSNQLFEEAGKKSAPCRRLCTLACSLSCRAVLALRLQ